MGYQRKSIGGATPAVDQEKGFVYYQYNGGVIKINALDGSVIKEIKVEKPNNVISWNTVQSRIKIFIELQLTGMNLKNMTQQLEFMTLI